jgi:hypothetical protein
MNAGVVSFHPKGGYGNRRLPGSSGSERRTMVLFDAVDIPPVRGPLDLPAVPAWHRRVPSVGNGADRRRIMI